MSLWEHGRFNMQTLKQLNFLPDSLLTATPQTLHSSFSSPTLIHLQGKKSAPLFVSVLLHGNEPTGFLALQALLKKYQNKTLPRSLSIFLGNTLAASHNLRHLDNQPDFNRIWAGTELAPCPETQLADQIVEIMSQRKVFASIDVHNNTGINPHYACITRLNNQSTQLARLFSRLVLYFLYPKGVQSAAFAPLCPSVTLECGRPSHTQGTIHVLDYLDSCLHLSKLANHPVLAQDIDLFQTKASVKIKPETHFSFSDKKADLLLNKNIERMNFTEVPIGTILGTVKNNFQMPVIALQENGNTVTDNFFTVQDNNLQINKKTMPSMLTLDERVIQQDCLCYLMERIHL